MLYKIKLIFTFEVNKNKQKTKNIQLFSLNTKFRTSMI